MSAFPVVNGVTVFLPPPEGYVVDFEHPQFQSKYEHYLVFAILGPLALLCLVQRLYTKIEFSDGLEVDDGLMILAWICSIAMQALQTWSIAIGGLCHHGWEMSIDVWEKQALVSYIVAGVFIVANGSTKASLFFAYLKISPERWYKRCIKAGIGMVATYTLTILALLMFGTQPIRLNWDPYLTGGTRLNGAILYMAIASSNIVSDVILFLIPIPMVLRLQMRPVVKFGALIMFGIGSITVTTSVVRMVYLQPMLKSLDTPWVAAPANVWSFVEVNLFIICGSLPTLRRFFRAIAPKLMGSSADDSRVKPAPHSHNSSRGLRSHYSQFDVELESVSSQKVILNDCEANVSRPATIEVKG
ncbi:hypothetical protein Cob_v004740 [Colletotrichum orbiculare MAFF 240422]|uniref:Rhodopsin domain-containing protein n=1 Tax=Colletotrichum orbiculare (strain 104-T / ATCC 96160 / CBS 514.97 / LARS 414 / MAFF 240422) TaxID=1213857 RepID=N4VCP7_COLOR|nr:hypothetical protein Cob_v004740 [Colletotrichum orbiculare MAFF 240422]